MEAFCFKCRKRTEHKFLERKRKETSKKIMVYDIWICKNCGTKRARMIR